MNPFPHLSPAQFEIMCMLAQGERPKTIAYRRKTSVQYVFRQIMFVKEKFGARTRDELMARFTIYAISQMMSAHFVSISASSIDVAYTQK